MASQLPLNITLNDNISFANYLPGPNQVVYEVIHQFIEGGGETYLYLWGGIGTGKSHLLQAICQYAAQHNQLPGYIPLQQCIAIATDPAMLEGMEQLDFVCLDDIEAICGMDAWEQKLFQLFNILKEHSVPLIITGNVPPNELNLTLNDLVSRLNWGGVFQLQSLEDEDKIQALQKHAKTRGLNLPDSITHYLVSHCSRDMQTLIEWLQKIDYASLAMKRKITLPFVRDLLKNAAPPLSIDRRRR